jgi:hypothetical protein
LADAPIERKARCGASVPAKGNKVHYFTGAVLGGVMAPAGFGVRVTEAGIRSFVLGYHHKGHKRRYTIGQWPTWTAMLAVKEARELRRRIDKGEDPLADWRREKAATETLFKHIDGEYHRLAGSKPRTGEERKGNVERLAFRWLGNMPIESIKRSDIRKMLDHVGEENGVVMADRLLAYVSKVMSWHATRSM